MNLSDIKSLYAYNRWANDRMFAAIEKVPNEKFGAPIVSSFPLLRETTLHILFAEWLWLTLARRLALHQRGRSQRVASDLGYALAG